MSSLLSIDNVVFSKFAFYSGAVLLKTVFMSLWTARHRIPKRVFISPEDYKGMGKAPQGVTSDPTIERIRRTHQNDLENVLPFVLIGLLYVTTKPEVATATLLFRLFAGSRFMHTLVYINTVPQPSRAIAFFLGIGVNIYMAVSVLRTFTY